MPLDVIAPTRTRDLAVTAPLLFLERANGKPVVKYGYDSALSETDAVYTPRSVTMQNARPVTPALDVYGFELAWRPSSIHASGAEEDFATAGRAEAAELVAAATGAARTHVFDHTFRRASPDALRQPSTRVHNDYTAASAAQRVRDLMGEEAEALLQRPFAFVNVWRPLRHPAVDWPLALCDARSVGEGELRPTDIVYPDRTGEIYGLVHAPQQRWWHYPDMQLDEALLIKCYDSRPDVARFTPHTAFESPLTPPGAPARESIEFRTIAFFD